MEGIITLTNSRGEEVAAELIPEVELKRHMVVEDIVAKILDYKKQGEKLSLEVDGQIEEYLNWLGKRSKIRNGEDVKGNIQLSNFGQTKQVKISIDDIISFDERLNLAKSKVDACLKRWTEKSGDKELSFIVKDAFNVDKKGNINKHQILKLLKINIQDREWIDAQKLIQESIQITTTKKYKNFRVKSNCKEKWETINLNFSSY